MDSFLVSVILPVYNIEKYLDKCMKSVLNQSYKNIEILLIDDGATDKCPEICEKYKRLDNRVKVFHKVNGGLSDARNYGIHHSQGEYITCIDPDDFIDLDYIEYLVDLIIKYKTKMSICQHRVIYDNGVMKDFGKDGEACIDTKMCLQKMLYHDIIDTSAWAKLYHKSLFERVEYPKGKIFEDIGTTYALMIQCDKIAIGYKSKYNYFFHENSIVNSSFKTDKLDLLEMTDKMATEVEKIYPDLKDAVMRRRVYSRLSTLNQMLDTSQCPNEKKSIISFIKINGNEVLKNQFAPKRDKMAIVLLDINYNLYKIIWKVYRKYIK